MVAACTQQFALGIEHVNDRAGTDLETGFGGLDRFLVGYHRVLQGLDLADVGNYAAIGVACLALEKGLERAIDVAMRRMARRLPTPPGIWPESLLLT